jgi:cation diffusion facilitator CzcD-associated flavoprotein CzcO
MAERRWDAVIVGAGFAGLYMLHRLRGLGLTARVLEAGSGVGGTWYWNRYPGARCDIESMQYSFQFDDELQQEWDWTERYAAQPEILTYANHVCDRFQLRDGIDFDTRVTSAAFDEAAGQWTVETDTGARHTATYCIMATGCLSVPNNPNFPGMGTFKGPTYHTGQWPHEGVDFTGQRVAMIGTGSSSIQSIPIIAAQAKHLTIFQRTANYAIPAHNHDLDPAYQKAWKADYAGHRARAKQTVSGVLFDFNDAKALDTPAEHRRAEYETRWQRGGLSFLGAYNDLLLDQTANDTAAAFVKAKIRAVVHDPKTADLLSPKNIIGCKRLCIDTGYFETFNRPNVSLIDIAETKIDAITPKGVKANGQEFEADAIVYATGFDAMTGALLRIDIRGKGGLALRDKWDGGPRSYLGLGVAGFPNLFLITGPGSPSVLSNMLPSIEQHVEWIARCIGHLGDRGLKRIEPKVEAEDAWIGHVNEVAGKTLRSTCSSWYIGANIPGKPKVFMPYIGGYPAYVKRCEEIVANGYEGFELR